MYKIYLTILLSFLCIFNSKAQNVNIVDLAGEVTSIELTKVSKITFSDSDVIFNLFDTNDNVFDLNNINYLSFKEIVIQEDTSHVLSVDEVKCDIKNNLKISVQDSKVRILYFSKSSESILIQILSINGVEIFSKNERIHEGINIFEYSGIELLDRVNICKIIGSEVNLMKFTMK